jgi:hypothetical protein
VGAPPQAPDGAAELADAPPAAVSEAAAAVAAALAAAPAAAVAEGQQGQQGQGQGQGEVDAAQAAFSLLKQWVDTAGDVAQVQLHARMEARAGRCVPPAPQGAAGAAGRLLRLARTARCTAAAQRPIRLERPSTK